MSEIDHQLREFLTGTAGLPLVYGETDCAPWTCSWIKLRRGVDPAVPFRGRYHNAAQAAVFVRREGGAGGMLAFSTRVFTNLGFMEVSDPLPGDVGCVEGPNGDGLAVRGYSGWAWKGDGFITVHPFKTLRAWRP